MATYACSDLHGRLDLYLKIKEILQPEDKVYFLGDANDRGFHGWELIKKIYDDPQFVYMKGNHEDMLVKAILGYMRNPNYPSRAYNLLKNNGGKITFDSWWEDGADTEWAKKLNALPLHIEYINTNGQIILLSHAGYTPWSELDDETKPALPFSENLLWDRDHIYEDFEEAECVKNCIVVHGHTTIPSMMRRLCDKREISYGTYWYCDNRKVCIDNYSVITGIVCLLNLDTLEEILIKA